MSIVPNPLLAPSPLPSTTEREYIPFVPPTTEQLEMRRLRKKLANQRKELRSLNKHLRYWAAVAKSKYVNVPVLHHVLPEPEPVNLLPWFSLGAVLGAATVLIVALVS